MYQRFYDHVAHLVSEYQHGFLRNRSCVTQLLSVLHTIGYYLHKNTQTDVLYLDFAKAFDSVDHAIILDKLSGYGVTRPVLCWFADYLNGRTQRVVVDGIASTWSPFTKVLTISRIHSKYSQSHAKNPVNYEYTLGAERLIRVDSEKDLGVITSSGLSRELHINSIISKANEMLGVLKRTCTLLTSMKTRRTLYLTLLKSHLCYATEIWSPVNSTQLSNQVEKKTKTCNETDHDEQRRGELQRSTVGPGFSAINI